MHRDFKKWVNISPHIYKEYISEITCFYLISYITCVGEEYMTFVFHPAVIFKSASTNNEKENNTI